MKLRPAGYLAPPETAVLTLEQLAAWLQVSPRQVERAAWVPWFTVGGTRSRRVLVRDVLKALAERAKAGEAA